MRILISLCLFLLIPVESLAAGGMSPFDMLGNTIHSDKISQYLTEELDGDTQTVRRIDFYYVANLLEAVGLYFLWSGECFAAEIFSKPNPYLIDLKTKETGSYTGPIPFGLKLGISRADLLKRELGQYAVTPDKRRVGRSTYSFHEKGIDVDLWRKVEQYPSSEQITRVVQSMPANKWVRLVYSYYSVNSPHRVTTSSGMVGGPGGRVTQSWYPWVYYEIVNYCALVPANRSWADIDSLYAEPHSLAMEACNIRHPWSHRYYVIERRCESAENKSYFDTREACEQLNTDSRQ